MVVNMINRRNIKYARSIRVSLLQILIVGSLFGCLAIENNSIGADGDELIHQYDGFWAAIALSKYADLEGDDFNLCKINTVRFDFEITNSKFKIKFRYGDSSRSFTTLIKENGSFQTEYILAIQGAEYSYRMWGDLTQSSGLGYIDWWDVINGDLLCQSEVEFSRIELRKYNNRYLDLIPGTSSFEVVKRLAGENLLQLSKTTHRFSQYVNVSFTEEGILKSISIFDDSYKDKNGFSIGAPKSDVLNLVGVGKYCSDASCLDVQHGIMYLFNETNLVRRIVLIRRALLK